MSSAMINTIFGRELDSALSSVIAAHCSSAAPATQKAGVANLCRKRRENEPRQPD